MSYGQIAPSLCAPSWQCICARMIACQSVRTSSPSLFSPGPCLIFGTLNHIVFIWKYFSCISASLKRDEDKGKEGKNTPCCVNPREGLEPCHSSLSLHQLSLIAREDRIPRAQLFLILFGASEAWKAKGLLLIFFVSFFFFFFSVILYHPSPKSETLFSLYAPLLQPRKIIIKLCFIK